MQYATLAFVFLEHVRISEHNILSMNLNTKLKKVRFHLGLTQDQMAEKLGLRSESRRARISEWEAGRGEPRREILIKYSDIAKVEIKQLIDDREDLILT